MKIAIAIKTTVGRVVEAVKSRLGYGRSYGRGYGKGE